MTKFEGFDLPNTTPVPDIVFDELLIHLTGNELKVLLYIIRRTYGFGKNADAISLSQFRKGIMTKDGRKLDRGCGIEHNRTILAALTSLEIKGYITSKKQNTKAGDCDTTIYKLHTKSASKAVSQASSDREVVTPRNYLSTVGGVVTPGNDGWLPQVTTVVTPGNTQETVLQETVLQENTFVQTERQKDGNFVTLARDGGGIVHLTTEDEVPLSTEEAEVSHSQWLSENVQQEEEVSAPGGGAPTDEPSMPAPAPVVKGIQPLQPTTDSTTGQARIEHATEQPTRIIPPVLTLPSKDKTHENGKCKKEEKPLLTKTADVRSLINAFRGYALIEEGAIKNQNKLIYSLCTLYPLEHFTAVMHHLKTCQCEKHKWWREKQHNRGFKAENLRDLLPDILTELGLIPKPEVPPSLANGTPPRSISSYAPWAPHEEIIPRQAVAH